MVSKLRVNKESDENILSVKRMFKKKFLDIVFSRFLQKKKTQKYVK